MLWTLADDGRPLYQQIASAVRRAVRSGELMGGDSLPPGRDLAEVLGVNLDTVQRAYRQLADEGVVESRVGRGTRVAAAPNPTAGLRAEVAALVDRASADGVTTDELVALVRSAAIGGRHGAPRATNAG